MTVVVILIIHIKKEDYVQTSPTSAWQGSGKHLVSQI